MTHYVYMLECADGSLYTGYTTDLEKRVSEHNGEGATRTARAGGGGGGGGAAPPRPVMLVYSESFSSRSAAMQREAAIKQLTRKEKEALLQ
ncbi:GIY-YIG nuclease family protein [Candidatus Nomurabacteria bacterium]|nr:GIY-YIG nuclease family protein [Candidatus Nomurabacteria bacterium]